MVCKPRIFRKKVDGCRWSLCCIVEDQMYRGTCMYECTKCGDVKWVGPNGAPATNPLDRLTPYESPTHG
jgi:hypothetical protein